MPRPRPEMGQASVEFVIVAVTFVLLCLLPIHFAIWFHATSVATAAAQEGARAARRAGAAPDAGVRQANAYLDRVGSFLEDRRVGETWGPDSVRVDVDAYAPALVPGLRLPVHAASAGVMERFRPEGARR